MKKYVINILVVLFVFAGVHSFAQKTEGKKELERKRKELQKDIENTDALLKETKNTKKRSLMDLLLINKKISAREELIRTINRELQDLGSQIKSNNESIEQLKRELEKLKKEYAQMVYYAWKNQDAYSRMMFVFASRDFEQAFLRLKYLQQYNDFRRKQATLIESKQNELNGHVKQLEDRKVEKNVLLGAEQSEKGKLSGEKSEKEEMVAGLQDKEKKLKRELDKKKRAARELQEAIARLIQREIEESRPKPKPGEKANNTPATRVFLSPSEMELSNKFSDNRGKLPWPLVKGVITERFGVHPHPLMPEIEISSNGIDISTGKGSIARAVFDGEVKGITTVPGAGKVVIIRHGEYLSVYANLNEVYIKNGDKVKTKDNIGTILFDEDENKTELHLEIWKGQTKLDPEDWLYHMQ